MRLKKAEEFTVKGERVHLFFFMEKKKYKIQYNEVSIMKKELWFIFGRRGFAFFSLWKINLMIEDEKKQQQ